MTATLQSSGQVVDESQVRSELQKQGIDDQEVERRLRERGFDIDNIDPNNPQELLAIQNATEEIIDEIKAENAAKDNETSSVEKDTIGIEISNVEAKKAEVDSMAEAERLAEIEELPEPLIYGQHLFREGAIQFYNSSTNINPGNNYILGVGDRVNVAIWGVAEATFGSEISQSGYVKFPSTPRLYVSGLTLKDAKELIKKNLKSYPFNDNTIEILVTSNRQISVNISGEVFKPGTYNLLAVNSAINALSAANGPTNIGSVRNIKVFRNNGSNSTIDLYNFLNDPQANGKYSLAENDFIVVPVAEKVVEISGAVNRPYRYELLPGEKLQKAIEFAGGLKANAVQRKITVKRFTNDKRELLTVDFRSSAGKNFALENGDVITVEEVESEVEQVVEVEGAVENPGTVGLKRGMKVADLFDNIIPSRAALLDRAYLLRLNDDLSTVSYSIVNLQEAINNRRSDANFELTAGDKLIIRAADNFVDQNFFAVSGAVRIEGEYQLDRTSELRLSDAIFLSGGLQPTASRFAFIYRNTPGQLTPEYISVDIYKVMQNASSEENILIAPGDDIRVFNKNTYEQQSFVSIEGAVRNPTAVEFDSTLTLKDMILLAQGLRLEAASNRIDIFRLELDGQNETRTLVANVAVDDNFEVVGGQDIQLSPFDKIVVRNAPEFEEPRAITLKGEVKYPGTYYLTNENTKISEVIKNAGGLTEEAFIPGTTLFRSKDEVGFVIIDVSKALDNNKANANVILQEGDVIDIPKRNDLVTIQGAVNANEVFVADVARTGKYTLVYEQGKDAKYYVDKYTGGFAENADKSKVTVTYPNGELKKTSKFLFFRNYPEVRPGSVINVAAKPQEPTLASGEQEEKTDWGSVLTSTISQATAVLSLILLIQNID